MVRWHHCLSGYELEQFLGDGEGQRSLACCSPWSHKESDNLVTEQQITNQGYRWSIQLLSSGDQFFPFERLPYSDLLDVIFSWVSS